MDVLAPVITLAAVLSCMVALGTFSFLYLSYRQPMLRSYLWYLGVASLQTVLSLTGQVISLASPGPLSPATLAWLQLPDLFILGAFIHTIPRFYADFAETTLKPRIGKLFHVWAIATILLAPLSLLPAALVPLPFLPDLVGFVGFLAAVFYSQALIIRGYPDLRERLYRIGIPVIVGYNILCLTGGTVDSLVSQGQLATGRYPHGVLFQPIMYALWNLVTFVWAVKSHSSGFFFGKSGSPAAPRGIDQRAARTLGLSEREIELVGLLAEGQANKEIAGRLDISVNTVRNHLSNIFQKTGSRNRVELLRKVWGSAAGNG